MIFVGVDWAEAHHDVCVLDQAGAVLGRRRGLMESPGSLSCMRWWPITLRSGRRWSLAWSWIVGCWLER